jgi:GDP-4-dehydro-6-deoxy-D-mannose reductase
VTELVTISHTDFGPIDAAQLPADEPQSLQSRGICAVSKVAAETLCFQWSQTEGLDAIYARPFNHDVPVPDEQFHASSPGEQICSTRVRCRMKS